MRLEILYLLKLNILILWHANKGNSEDGSVEQEEEEEVTKGQICVK